MYIIVAYTAYGHINCVFLQWHIYMNTYSLMSVSGDNEPSVLWKIF